MNDQRKILDMLAEGKITAEDAEKLLTALKDTNADTSSPVKSADGTPSFLCVKVQPKGESGERVNVKIPLKVIKAGFNLSSLIPENARKKTESAMGEKGVNFDFKNLKPENIDEFLRGIADLRVDVDNDTEKVEVYCI